MGKHQITGLAMLESGSVMVAVSRSKFFFFAFDYFYLAGIYIAISNVRELSHKAFNHAAYNEPDDAAKQTKRFMIEENEGEVFESRDLKRRLQWQVDEANTLPFLLSWYGYTTWRVLNAYLSQIRA
jgi:hypothetical protein